MVILDLFAGTGSATQAFEDAGHHVVKVELDPRHDADYHYDVALLTPTDVHQMCGGRPDFIWASPPCTAFSVASIGHHWGGGHRVYEPKTLAARQSIDLVRHTLGLIEAVNPRWWLMENPRGVLRKMAAMADLTRWTVTYCQYGDERMKPTDLWGKMPPGWTPKPMCKNGATCHASAPRGARTGTQGRSGAVNRSRVPLGLSREVLAAVALPRTGRCDA